MYKDINVAYISSYIPRHCGIATFTNDLATSVTNLTGEDLADGRAVQITAITNTPEGYKYGPEVKFEIKEQNLNDYKEATDREKEVYASSLTSYLLTVCWEKMYNRISSWPAIGLMSELHASIGTLSEGLNRFHWDALSNNAGRGDRTLANTLTDAGAKEAIPMLMRCLKLTEHQSVSDLLVAAKVAVANGSYCFYNKDTAKQFHCLLVAVLIGFASSLRFVKSWKHLYVSMVHN